MGKRRGRRRRARRRRGRRRSGGAGSRSRMIAPREPVIERWPGRALDGGGCSDGPVEDGSRRTRPFLVMGFARSPFSSSASGRRAASPGGVPSPGLCPLPSDPISSGPPDSRLISPSSSLSLLLPTLFNLPSSSSAPRPGSFVPLRYSLLPHHVVPVSQARPHPLRRLWLFEGEHGPRAHRARRYQRFSPFLCWLRRGPVGTLHPVPEQVVQVPVRFLRLVRYEPILTSR